MKVTIEETATKLWISADSPGTLHHLYEAFKVQPPDYWRAPTFQLWKKTKGQAGWDGWLHQLHRWKGPSGAWLARGHRPRLLEVCHELGIETKLKLMASPFTGLALDDVPDNLLKGLTLDHNQRQCIQELLRHATGTVEVSVSGGKTAIFLAAVTLVRKQLPSARFLYVTPSERLVNQVRQEAAKLAPWLKVSQLGGGKKDESGRDLVVATSASLSRHKLRLTEAGWFNTFMGLCYDEVHHAASPTSREVVDLVPAFFRWGASDSVKDSHKADVVKGTVIRGMFGPALHRIIAAPLIELGRLAKPHIYLIDRDDWGGKFDGVPRQAEPGSVAWRYDQGDATGAPVWVKGEYVGPAQERDDEGNLVRDSWGETIQELGWHTIKFNGEPTDVPSRWCLLQRQHDQAITRFRERNEAGIRWAMHWAQKGWPTLVVATRTLHVAILEHLLLEAGHTNTRVLTGKDSTKARDETFKWLVESEGGILISPLVKEGVSLPELRAGVVLDYVAGPDVARQILGRFIRRKPTGDNEAHVAMFVDRQTTAMRRGSLALIKELERLRGYTYHWPCSEPAQIDQAQVFEAASLD